MSKACTKCKEVKLFTDFYKSRSNSGYRSWCKQCKAETLQLIMRYNKWKAKEVEVVMVSLDTDKKAFEEFASDFPYTIACDYKKWDTQAAKDYYVSSSPTIFLLDSNNKIILRPATVASLDSWLESNIFK